MNRESVGSRLRTLRGDMSQAELAEKLDVTQASICLYESGERVPSDKVKDRYATFFKKTIQEIFYD